MSEADQHARLKIQPLGISLGLRQQACEAIKRAIMAMDIYGHPEEIRLDERQLSQDLGVSRTPIREALSVLEQEGFVRSRWGTSENNRKAKFYELTRAGQGRVRKAAAEWEKTTEILARFLSPGEEA